MNIPNHEGESLSWFEYVVGMGRGIYQIIDHNT